MMIYLLLIAAVGITSSQGTCPDLEVVQNFNVTAYLGRWYEHAKYPTLQEEGGRCVLTDYSIKDGAIRLRNEMIFLDLFPVHLDGTLNFTSTNGEAKLMVTPDILKIRHVPYWVLSTDYTSYSVMWYCREILGFTSGKPWILTRERNPPNSVLEIAYQVLKDNNISLEKLEKTDQANCTN
ncbi:unnamed protein product [Psylliodes chrysocephalus]|uniref:Lipocalin/cytosolic fatty-acid binding domain-containing protein n=1 Tax=Psylliodes chrysocephalus TaxID=3402493 RepID=A0A9P0G7B1_9CUCU|nr:unnamed protein product [Psylliodes chrysocephala]